VGYNGSYSGGPNTCDRDEPGNCGCLHAEDNAISKAPYHGVEKLILFTTHTPCEACAKRIITSSKVTTVIFLRKYRSDAGIELLRKSGIEVVSPLSI
jgi:deoxycytidylate deaminase